MKTIGPMLLLAAVNLANATVHMVSPEMSIQSVVANALNGDSVVIQDGQYTETVLPYGKTLTIGSLYLLDNDNSHCLNTMILPGFTRPDTNSCFVYAYGESEGSRLVGLTLVDGAGTRASPYNDICGGGIYVRGATLSVEHCRILNCSAYLGGGVAVMEFMPPETSICSIWESTVDGCSAAGWGGGIYVWGGELELRTTQISQNTAPGNGGGIYIVGRRAVVDACMFIENEGDQGGAYISALDGIGTHSLTNSTFSGNRVTPFGGACTDLFLAWCDALVQGCLFVDNGSPVVAVILDEYDTENRIDFQGNVVENCTALNCCGPVTASYLWNGDFAYNILQGNRSLRGALSVGFNGYVRRVHHNAFLDNIAPEGIGSVLYIPWNCYVGADSNVFAGNSAPAVGRMAGWPALVHVEGNWWGDATGPYHQSLNPFGQGDSILQDSIVFAPWLTEPPDTSYVQLVNRRDNSVSRTWHILYTHPNPFNQTVTLVIAGVARDDFEISLYNLLGQVVDVVHRGPLTGGQLHYQAPPWLSSGVYLLAARDKQGVQTKKVVLLK